MNFGNSINVERSNKLPVTSTPFSWYYTSLLKTYMLILSDSIENIPKFMEDIAQTSINTGPRGALRLAQGVQAFLGGGGEWLADVSKVVHASIVFLPNCEKWLSL